MKMTQSEKNIERVFLSIGIAINKVPEDSEKTPDYSFSINGQSIYLEVKEIEENEEERIILRKLDELDEIQSYESKENENRFRSGISKGNRQLKKRCKNGEPGLVVIQDLRSFFTKSFNPQEEMKQAMFGDHVTWCSVPNQYNQYHSRVVADNFGRNRTTTDKKNTTISAVALLFENYETRELTLLIHHNPHAKNPLPNLFSSFHSIKEYRVDSTREYGHFVEV